ncbi:MAG: metallophosphoesterase family protein, partial [Nitrospirae bacterium]|nr:metallophosphoesterase family protein [Nitrospirota bacterium]
MGGSYRYAVISDVHSNLEALRAVFDDINREKIKDVLFVGDVVGYGPDPVECIEFIRKRCIHAVAGNHDWAVIGYTPSEYFNYNARVAIEWTKEQLDEGDFEFLQSLNIVKVLKKESLFLVHASPKEPDSWNYILSLYDAEINFQYFKERICLIGHSHVPFIIEKLPSGEIVLHREKIEFKESCRYIINVGSV